MSISCVGCAGGIIPEGYLINDKYTSPYPIERFRLDR